MSDFTVVKGNLHNINQEHFIVINFQKHPLKHEDIVCIAMNEKNARGVADAMNFYYKCGGKV